MIEITDYIPEGAAHPIPMRQLAQILHCSSREARAAVQRARLHGAPICSTCDPNGGGYFLARSADEAAAFVRCERARIRTARAAIRAIEAAFREGDE